MLRNQRLHLLPRELTGKVLVYLKGGPLITLEWMTQGGIVFFLPNTYLILIIAALPIAISIGGLSFFRFDQSAHSGF